MNLLHIKQVVISGMYFYYFFSLLYLSYLCRYIWAQFYGSDIGSVSINEIDWTQNSLVSLVAALVSTLVLHNSKK